MAHSQHVWIGLSDRGTEGQWRFPTNKKIFDTDAHDNVFKWAAGEPNNWGNNQDCVYVGYLWVKGDGNGLMDDTDCENAGFYGLCEIKAVDKCQLKRS